MCYSTANEFNVLSWDTSYCQEMHDFKLQDSITWIGTGILFQMSTQVIQCHPQMLRLLFSLIPCVCLFWELNFDMYSSYMIQWLAAKCQLSRSCAKSYAQTFQCNGYRWPSGKLSPLLICSCLLRLIMCGIWFILVTPAYSGQSFEVRDLDFKLEDAVALLPAAEICRRCL